MAGTTTVGVMPSMYVAGRRLRICSMCHSGSWKPSRLCALEHHVGEDAVDAVLHLVVKPSITLLTTIIVATPSITLMIDASAM